MTSACRRTTARPVALIASTVVSVMVAMTLTALPANAALELDTIPVGDAPQQIAISADSTTAYVSNFGTDTVSIISLVGQPTTTVSVGDQPSGIALRPASTEVWVTNLAGDTVSVISTVTRTVTTTFAVGDGPINLIFNSAGTRAYISYYNAGTVGVINTSTKVAVGSPIAVDALPTGLALDESRNRLLSVGSNANRVTVVDLLGVVASTLVTVGTSPRDIVVSTTRDRAYVSNNGSDSVTVINLATLSTTPIAVGAGPVGLGLHPTAPYLYTANLTDGSVSVVTIENESVIDTIDTANGTLDVAMAPDARTLYSVNRASDNVSIIDASITRLQGLDRYLTAIAISSAGFASGASTVFIASGAGFADALSAGAAAAELGAPLLLTPPSALLDTVRDEIIRLNPSRIVIVGGTGVISSAVEVQLDLLAPTVDRIAGEDRYETSRMVVSSIFTAPTYQSIFLATGRDFPDALSAGPSAGQRGVPILLVDGAAGSLPAATLALIQSKSPNEIVLVGGTAVVSTGIANQLDVASFNVSRVAGADRYETSAEINRDFYQADGVMWATGTAFPDALAGISLQGLGPTPLYLVRPTCVPSAAANSIWQIGADTIYILGGTASVSSAVEARQFC